MRRAWILVAGAALTGCAGIDDFDLFGPGVIGGTSTGLVTGAASSTSGTGGEGGAGGGLATASSSATGTGGEGGACEPKPTPCAGATCGSADDGCGHTVQCGSCFSNQVCTAGACCTPDITCKPGQCGAIDDGCGGMKLCPTNCGNGSAWQACGADNVCHCADVDNYPNADTAKSICGAKTAVYCGQTDLQLPAGCKPNIAGGVVPPPDGAALFCCG
jgi:hypothetical protein